MRGGVSRRTVLRGALAGAGGAMVAAGSGGCVRPPRPGPAFGRSVASNLGEPVDVKSALRRHYDVHPDTLARRTVRGSPVLVALLGEKGYGAAVLDPETDGFVRPPALNRSDRRVLAFAPHGQTVAVRPWTMTGGDLSLGLQALSTGEERWFDPESGGLDQLVAFSPDGGSLAVLSSVPDPDADQNDPEAWGLTAVAVINVASGGRRRLWARLGGMSAESGIGWSPNGRRIAATYLYPTGPGEDDVATATVVVDLAGDEVAHLESVNLVPPNNGGWIDDDRILAHPELDDEWHQAIVDVRRGTRTIAGAISPNPCAKSGPYVLTQAGRAEGDEYFRLVRSGLDGAHPRPFLTVHGRFALDGCFLAGP